MIDVIKSYCLICIFKYEKFYVFNFSEEKFVFEIFNVVICINNCSKYGYCIDKGNYFFFILLRVIMCLIFLLLRYYN